MTVARTPLAMALLLAAMAAGAQTTPAESRGRLLYDNHCGACHSTQMHWREKRLATDWASLVAQVRRWQAVAHLNWSDEDIADVARHLNQTIYRFPLGTQVGGLTPGGTRR